MKAKLTLTLLALAAVTINLNASTSALPAPLPGLMTHEQLAKNTQQVAAEYAAKDAAASEPSTQFYTGKPYVADAGGYIYKYRTYNPEMSRWTTTDPSGYPDGVNNFVYAPNPMFQLDDDGLQTVTETGSAAETLTSTMETPSHWTRITPTFQTLLTSLQGSAIVKVSLTDVWNGSSWATTPSNAAIVSATNPGGSKSFTASYDNTSGSGVNNGSGTYTLSGLKATISTAAPVVIGSNSNSITFNVPVTLNYTEAANIQGANSEGSATPTETIYVSVEFVAPIE